MIEDEVLVLENGMRICPACLAGEIKTLGGPIKLGIEDAWNPEVMFLCKCDVCSTHYQLRDEQFRLSVVERYGVKNPNDI